jgi:hypothetical protein
MGCASDAPLDAATIEKSARVRIPSHEGQIWVASRLA